MLSVYQKRLYRASNKCWQGWQDENQTFDDEIKCDPNEIRALFEDEDQNL